MTVTKNEKDFSKILNEIFENMGGEEKGFSNEAQLQYELALRLKDYNIVKNVELEVLSTNLSFEDFQKIECDIKKEKYYTDIIVDLGKNKYVAIELKFKTPEYKNDEGKERIRKHTTTKGKVFYTCSQGAENEGSYYFWKDVERLEKFTNNKKDENRLLLNFDTSKMVKQKFAILMTNSKKYWTREGFRNSINKHFFPIESNKDSIEKNEFSGELVYNTRGNNKENKNEKNKKEKITLSGRYTCNWKDYIELEDKTKFRYLILKLE